MLRTNTVQPPISTVTGTAQLAAGQMLPLSKWVEVYLTVFRWEACSFRIWRTSSVWSFSIPIKSVVFLCFKNPPVVASSVTKSRFCWEPRLCRIYLLCRELPGLVSWYVSPCFNGYYNIYYNLRLIKTAFVKIELVLKNAKNGSKREI